MAEQTTHKDLKNRVRELDNEVTQLRQSEKDLTGKVNQLMTMLTGGPAVIYRCKAVGDYSATFITENIKDQLGYTPQDFTENPRFWVDHVHPEDRDGILAGIQKLFEKGSGGHEYRFKHKDGSYRWMLDELVLVRDSEGKPTEIIGFWADISEKKQMEIALKKQTRELEEANISLKILLRQTNEAKDELEKNILANIKSLLMPSLNELRMKLADKPEMAYVNVVVSNINQITSSFSKKLSSQLITLTPRETQIADLIRQGKTNKDIARLLSVSVRTVDCYRDNIRKKLDLKSKKINLRTYLSSLT